MARESAEDIAHTVDSLDVRIDLARVYHSILGQARGNQHTTHAQPQSATGSDCTFRLMSIVRGLTEVEAPSSLQRDLHSGLARWM